MEYNKVETTVIADAISKSLDEQIRDLDELQLALVGGGGVDVGVALEEGRERPQQVGLVLLVVGDEWPDGVVVEPPELRGIAHVRQEQLVGPCGIERQLDPLGVGALCPQACRVRAGPSALWGSTAVRSRWHQRRATR